MLKESIDFLSQNYDLPITSKKIQSHLEIVESNKNNPDILNLINQHYRPTEININTVGSYLWGCSQKFYGDVNKNCSPLCTNSISHDFFDIKESYDFSNLSKCQYSIWTYQNNILKNEYKTLSTKAYIFVENWNGFSEKDIEILKSSGISFVSILNTKNSQHKILLQMTSLDNLPLLKEFNIPENIEKKEDSSYSYWVYLIFFLFVLAIVKLIIYK